MGKRTYESDIIAMALLYRKEYVGTDMIAYDKALNFDKVINGNLDKMEANCGIGIRCETPSQLYRLVMNEDKELYAVINPNVDLKRMWEYHVYILPTEVIKASYMDNALKEIGLIEVNEKIIDRKIYYNELRVKHNLTKEFVKESFDIFKDWESIPENGFVENFCISDAERNILIELRENRRKNSAKQGFTKVKK